MRSFRAVLLVLVAGLAGAAMAVPQILIAQLKPVKDQKALESPICDYLANELQSKARLSPIVWGMTDPVYRAAVEAGKFKTGDDNPTLSDLLSVASKLNCEYVLAVDLRSGLGEVLCAAFLYKGGRIVWKDPDLDVNTQLANLKRMLKSKKMTQEEYDRQVLRTGFRASALQLNSQFGLGDSVRSIARTWSEMINSGPALGLPKQPEKATPDPGQGQTPIHTDITAPPKVDNRWAADVAAALKTGDVNQAISVLRDAIDASPLDPARRILLINTLSRIGENEAAAREARRAAELMTEHLEFRAMAAKNWIQAGKSDEAQEDLNEAVTRAPDSPVTRTLLAYVAIGKGDLTSAISHLTKAIEVAPSGDAFYMRGLAYAMSGENEKAAADMASATAKGLSQDPDEGIACFGIVGIL